MKLIRVCARVGCDQVLPSQFRSDARYCNSSCRREAARARKPVSGEINAPQFDWSAMWRVARRTRPSRRSDISATARRAA